MNNQIIIEKMTCEHTDSMLKLWKEQLKQFCSNEEIRDYWVNKHEGVLRFMLSHAKKGAGVVAVKAKEVVGYIAYDTFRFHDAESVFVPFVGNAASEENKNEIYERMYQTVSSEWLNKGIRNHYITIPFHDIESKSTLFDLGFGSYLIDAFAKPLPLKQHSNNQVVIRRADSDDLIDLNELVIKSSEYYASSPIFLMREEISMEQLAEIVANGNVFIAIETEQEKMIGFIMISSSEEDDIINMCPKKSGLIDELGAFILEEYRNQHVGYQLLDRVFKFATSEKLANVHVDFETANLYANKFWRKYFTPELLSLKRTLHADTKKETCETDFLVQ